MRRALILVVWPLLGCSSVPDVIFADVGADTTSSADAAADSTTTVVDAGTAYSCPDHPPPYFAGVCCGTRLCVKCNVFQCDRCEKDDCTSPDVCCAKNGGTMGSSVVCQPAATCN